MVSRSLALIAAMVCGVVLFPQVSHADLFTELATWNTGAEGGATVGSVRAINIDAGASYSNTRDSDFDGSTFHAVFGFRVTVLDSTTEGSLDSGDFGSFNLIGAAKGTQTGDPTNATAQFTDGFIGIAPGTGSFFTDDPSTWANLTEVLTQFQLKDATLENPESAATGSGETIPFSSVTNSVQNANIAQEGDIGGTVAFREIINDFIDLETFTPGPGFDLSDFNVESLIADFNENIRLAGLDLDEVAGGTDNDFAIGPDGLLDLNAIFSFFFPGEDFATGLDNGGAVPTNFDPIGPPDGGTPGDFAASIQADLFPSSQFEQQVIPEPASILVWSVIGAVVAGGAFARRRRGKNAA